MLVRGRDIPHFQTADRVIEFMVLRRHPGEVFVFQFELVDAIAVGGEVILERMAEVGHCFSLQAIYRADSLSVGNQ